jgi:hypothetical protein
MGDPPLDPTGIEGRDRLTPPDTTGDDSWPTERRDRWVGIEFSRLVERLKVDVDAGKIA